MTTANVSKILLRIFIGYSVQWTERVGSYFSELKTAALVSVLTIVVNLRILRQRRNLFGE